MKLRAILTAVAFAALSSPAMAAQGSGCLPTTGIVSGLTYTQNINAAIAALISSNSGASAPNTDCTAAPVKGQLWLNTAVTPNVMNQYDGSAWVVLGSLDATNHLWAPPVGGGAASIAAASTTDICAAAGSVQSINGTTAITSFGSSCSVGVRKTLIFNSATPLTYNASSLIIPGQQSYTTSPGDLADAIYLGAGAWRIASITKIDGSAVTNPAIPLGSIFYGIYAAPPAKAVYGAGQALSRASYPAYFAAVTRTQSGTLSAGSNSISSVANTAGLGAGMPVEGNGIQSGTVISSVSGSSITMSKTATANGSQSFSVIIIGYGSGGDSTTVGVPDCRGRVLAGRDDMLGTAATRLTATYFGANASTLGSVGGTESQTLTAAQLPSITSTNASQSISVDAPGYFPYAAFSSWTNASGGSGGIVSVPYTGGINTGIFSGKTSTGNNSISVTSTGTGGGAHPNVQPTAIAECVVAVLP